jgi:hypothetical protein
MMLHGGGVIPAASGPRPGRESLRQTDALTYR